MLFFVLLLLLLASGKSKMTRKEIYVTSEGNVIDIEGIKSSLLENIDDFEFEFIPLRMFELNMLYNNFEDLKTLILSNEISDIRIGKRLKINDHVICNKVMLDFLFLKDSIVKIDVSDEGLFSHFLHFESMVLKLGCDIQLNGSFESYSDIKVTFSDVEVSLLSKNNGNSCSAHKKESKFDILNILETGSISPEFEVMDSVVQSTLKEGMTHLFDENNPKNIMNRVCSLFEEKISEQLTLKNKSSISHLLQYLIDSFLLPIEELTNFETGKDLIRVLVNDTVPFLTLSSLDLQLKQPDSLFIKPFFSSAGYDQVIFTIKNETIAAKVEMKGIYANLRTNRKSLIDETTHGITCDIKYKKLDISPIQSSSEKIKIVLDVGDLAKLRAVIRFKFGEELCQIIRRKVGNFMKFRKGKNEKMVSYGLPVEPPTEMSYSEIYNLLVGSPEKYEERSIIIRCFQQLYFYSRVILRVFELFFRFTPLIVSHPVLVKFSPFESTVDHWYQWLLSCLRQSGPVFIKLGQWVGTRRDLFNDRLCYTMKELHSVGDIHTFSESAEVLKSSLGLANLEEAFVLINKKPVGTGAIAQVYDARMKVDFLRKNGYPDIQPDTVLQEKSNETGSSVRVAVKIRHPGIFNVMIRDLSILRTIFSMLGFLEKYKWLELDQKLVRFSGHLISQMNLKNEAINLEIFRNNFANMKGIEFPKPYSKITDEFVLIESFEDGVPSNEIIENKELYSEKVRRTVSRYGVIVFLKMLITDNFLHADLHPGNMFVKLKVDEKTQEIRPCLVMLDTGLIVKLDKATRYKFYDILLGVARRDGDYCARIFIRGTKEYQKYINVETNELDFSLVEDEVERKRLLDFIEAIKEMVCDIVDSPLGENHAAPVLSKLLGLSRDTRITLDNDIVNVIVATIVSEGLARELFHTVKFLKIAEEVLLLPYKARKDFYMNSFDKIVEKEWIEN